jgi:hypothetical protein
VGFRRNTEEKRCVWEWNKGKETGSCTWIASNLLWIFFSRATCLCSALTLRHTSHLNYGLNKIKRKLVYRRHFHLLDKIIADL